MIPSFTDRVDATLSGQKERQIEEGTILNVNKLISDAIKVPEGDYVVALIDCDRCVLVPTTEAANQQKFEVFKPTLTGFFNPEIHKRTVTKPDGPTIAEKAKTNSPRRLHRLW